MSADIIRGIYSAFGRGDVPAILERLTDDVVWRWNGPTKVPYGGERRGRGAVAEWFSTMAGAAEFTKFVPQGFIANGEHVVVIGEEEGRARPTGRTWQTRWAHVWTFRKGKVASFEDFFDSAAVAAAFD